MEDSGGPPIERIQGHLAGVAHRIQAAARRSRRFSWLSWGFLFAAVGGEGLLATIGLLFPVVTTTVSRYGSSTSTSSSLPWWGFAVSFAPAVILLALAVREIVVGRREDRSGLAEKRFAGQGSPSGAGLSWTETVQQCQRQVTHAKNETEWSFVPMVLGLFLLVELLGAAIDSLYMFSFGGTFVIVLFPAIALVSLVMLWPLYRTAKRWIGDYQGLLDRQVGELSRLEAEFLWRFAGGSAPG